MIYNFYDDWRTYIFSIPLTFSLHRHNSRDYDGAGKVKDIETKIIWTMMKEESGNEMFNGN